MASESMIEITDENFDAEVLQSDQPVLLDFWAEWCVPCKMLMPVVEGIAEANQGQIKVGKINMDNNMKIAVDYGIQGIPTLLLFKGGEVVDRFGGGNLKRDQIQERLDPHVSAGAGEAAGACDAGSADAGG